MYTDPASGGDSALKLDNIAEDTLLLTEIRQLEEKQQRVVFLEASLDHFDRIRSALLNLRASNLAAILILTPCEPPPTPVEIEGVTGYLRDWDQLFLQNILTLFQQWMPAEFQAELQMEAKIELKWFKEWFTASADERISKYPGLPWRAFIRKTIHENYEFAMTFLRYGAPESPERNDINLRNFIRSFLRNKKKAINTYPKKWGRLQ